MGCRMVALRYRGTKNSVPSACGGMYTYQAMKQQCTHLKILLSIMGYHAQELFCNNGEDDSRA